ncbi:MAG: hypothetical protein ACXWW4_18310 [Candidatus Binatia bacterium]
MKISFKFRDLSRFLLLGLTTVALAACSAVQQGGQIKKELKLPEYADWAGQNRLGLYIDAAYKSVKK